MTAMNDITTHACGLMTRISNSGNLMVVTRRENGTVVQSTPTAEQWIALGIKEYHNPKIAPRLTRDQLREVRATEAMVRAENNAPAGLTDEEIDDIGERAYEDCQ